MHHKFDGHLNFIFNYISLYYEVGFNINYDEETFANVIELCSGEENSH